MDAEFYVSGEVTQLIEFFKKNDVIPDGISSYDVIEHIYDLEEFLKKLALLDSKHLILVMTTGANGYNPVIKRKLIKIQIRLENEDRQNTFGYKQRDSLRSYSKIRRKIISKNFPKLDNDEIVTLTQATRGMIRKNILKCVETISVPKLVE